MSLWDEISKLVSGAGQSIGQTFSQPGSIMEAIGVPLALLGSYEAARGKPIGTPLSLAGGGLTYFGDQRSQSAQAQESFKRALALLKQQMSPTNGYGSGNKAGPPSPMGPGLQETVDAIGNLGQADPQAGMTAIQNQLQHYWATNAKGIQPKIVEGPNKTPLLLDPTTMQAKTFNGVPGAAAGGTPGGIYQHPLERKLFEMGVDVTKATPQQVKDANQALLAEQFGNKEALAKMMAKYGMVGVANDDGSMSWMPKASAPGRMAKPAPLAKAPTGFTAVRVPSLPGATGFVPSPPSSWTGTAESWASSMIGMGIKPKLLYKGKMYGPGEVVPGLGAWDGKFD